jgi:copper(I)-binding protein
MRRTPLFVSLSLLALAGCAKAPEPAAAPGVTGATVQLPAVAGRPAVAYFTLTAPAKAALVAVQVAHFARAEMHLSKMEGGAMTMDQVAQVPLTPGKPIAFAPGGYHVMLFDGDGTLKPGDTADLSLKLDTGATITGKAKVTAQGGDAMAGMKM